MYKVLFTSIVYLFLSAISFAQTTNTKTLPPIMLKGKITFERKLNMHKQMDDMMKGNQSGGGMFEQMKKQVPRYKTDIFELFFTDNKSIYKPAPDGISESKMMMGNLPAEKNVVYNDYELWQQIAEKKIFEKTYLISDSFRNHQWKITEEYRKIAGYNCRRAETIIMDSVYVIAFYTDAIVAPGGPESFNGLPGMILGVVLPRLNLTYFASKIDNYLPDEKVISPPSKGDKKTSAEVSKTIKSSMSNWGSFVERIMWYVHI